MNCTWILIGSYLCLRWLIRVLLFCVQQLHGQTDRSSALYEHQLNKTQSEEMSINKVLKVAETDVRYHHHHHHHRSVGLRYLEAVLIRHKLLRFALVGPLCCGPGCLRGQQAPRGFIGTFAQVHVRHTRAYIISDKVLELWKQQV